MNGCTVYKNVLNEREPNTEPQMLSDIRWETKIEQVIMESERMYVKRQPTKNKMKQKCTDTNSFFNLSYFEILKNKKRFKISFTVL